MKALQTLYKNLEEAGRHEFLNWVRDFGQECHRKPEPEEACFRVRRHTMTDREMAKVEGRESEFRPQPASK